MCISLRVQCAPVLPGLGELMVACRRLLGAGLGPRPRQRAHPHLEYPPHTLIPHTQPSTRSTHTHRNTLQARTTKDTHTYNSRTTRVQHDSMTCLADIYVADLSRQGVTQMLGLQLDGQRCTRARYPNANPETDVSTTHHTPTTHATRCTPRYTTHNTQCSTIPQHHTHRTPLNDDAS